jgi:hypothetical protein
MVKLPMKPIRMMYVTVSHSGPYRSALPPPTARKFFFQKRNTAKKRFRKI